MVKFGFLSLALLSVGVTLGYWMGSKGGATEDSQEPVPAKASSVRQSHDDTQDRLRQLRRRIAELERQLAQSRLRTEKAVSNVPPPTVAAAAQERPRSNPFEWLDNLRKADPARYTQMTNRFAHWRRSRRDQNLERMDFLSSIDASQMSEAAQKTHQDLQDLIAQREDLEARLNEADISSDERLRLMEEMHQTNHEFRRLNREERQNLLAETVRQLGFDGDDVKEITTTLQEVIQATDSGFGRGPRGLGPPPGGRGPGGRR